MEKPSHYSAISHPIMKECYGNTEGRAITTAEDSWRCSNLKHIFNISHMVELCWACSLFNPHRELMRLMKKKGNWDTRFSSFPSYRDCKWQIWDPTALHLESVFFNSAWHPSKRLQRGQHWSRAFGEQVGLCHGATCEVAETMRKPSQVRSSPRLPSSGDILLFLWWGPKCPMAVSVAAWTPVMPWPIFACLIRLHNWTGCHSLLTWLVGSLTQQKWDLRGLKCEKKIIQMENSSFSSRALD